MRSQHTLALALAAVATSLDVRPAPLRPLERRSFLGASAAALAAPRAAVAGSDGVRPAPAAIPVATKLFDLQVPFKGKPQPLSKFRGSAHLVVNIKMDDPVAGENFNALRYVAANYADKGLRVWAFPTEQGYYEPDVSELVRAKAYSQFGFGTYPTAVVFDKIDVIGNTAHPLYRYLALATNPNGVGRLTVNFEKFLLDGDGKPLRRYPRKFTPYDFEADVAAAVEGRPLAAPTAAFKDAWVKADQDAKKGEYSFRAQYNVWDQSEPSRDWDGLAELSFT